MRKPFVFLFLCVAALSSCKKQEVPIATIPATTHNPFGVIVNKTEGVNLGVTGELNVAKSLSAAYVRQPIILSQWTGTDAYQDAIIANGFKSVTNLNWGVPSISPVPFLTSSQLSDYKATITQVINKYPSELFVIENEETNNNYHSGSVMQYVDMLKAAADVIHAKGLKLANAGLTYGGLQILVWKDYLATGQTAKANDYALRSFSPDVYAALPSVPAALDVQAKKDDTLLNAYASLPLDYINFHWYGDTRQKDNGPYNAAIDTLHIDTRSLTELVDYLKRRTNKPIITNEIGEKYFSPGYVTDILTATLTMGLPYVVWYDGDGDAPFNAKGLHAASGQLRAAGTAYRDFIKSHFP